MERLECLFCQSQYPVNVHSPFCPQCREPLFVSYAPRKRTFFLEKNSAVEKFLDFLPLSKFDTKFSLGEGNTPLVYLERLTKKLNLRSIFAKNETQNPTLSFKDRGTAVAVQKAVSLGLRRIGTISTGNMAASTAAYGARAGLETFVLLKEGTSSQNILFAGIHGPVLITVEGDYGQLFYESFSLGQKCQIYFINSVDPFRIEGYKVTGFEIFLQLESQAPQYIFVPLSSGGHLIGLMRSFLDLKQQGLVQHYPTFVGVQAQGCSPLAQAYASGSLKFNKIEKVRTIAHAISNPNPPGGKIVLKMIQDNRGIIIAVSDEEILGAQKMLAEEEGIFCQPDSATTLAGLIKLTQQIEFQDKDKIVLVLTGSGLKNLKGLDTSKMKVHAASLATVEEKIIALLSSQL